MLFSQKRATFPVPDQFHANAVSNECVCFVQVRFENPFFRTKRPLIESLCERLTVSVHTFGTMWTDFNSSMLLSFSDKTVIYSFLDAHVKRKWRLTNSIDLGNLAVWEYRGTNSYCIISKVKVPHTVTSALTSGTAEQWISICWVFLLGLKISKMTSKSPSNVM